MKLARTLLITAFTVLTSLGLDRSPSLSASLAAQRDGSHDFDWEFGSWTTTVRVRLNPLSPGPADWASYRGQSVIRPLLAGRANFVELSVAGPRGRIEGGSLRLYDPQTGQWSLNYSNVRDGRLTAPVYGGFDSNGRGTFYGQDFLDGKAILVRFKIVPVTKTEVHFEQAYSATGGVTWEDNWIAVDTSR